MSIPGISAAMEGVGVGAGVGWVPDMSIPGMSAAMEGVGVGAGAGWVPDMSIPGMSIPSMPPEPAGEDELACASPEPWSIPAIPTMEDEPGLNANIITATTPATARTTAAITMRRVPVMVFMEMSSR